MTFNTDVSSDDYPVASDAVPVERGRDCLLQKWHQVTSPYIASEFRSGGEIPNLGNASLPEIDSIGKQNQGANNQYVNRPEESLYKELAPNAPVSSAPRQNSSAPSNKGTSASFARKALEATLISVFYIAWGLFCVLRVVRPDEAKHWASELTKYIARVIDVGIDGKNLVEAKNANKSKLDQRISLAAFVRDGVGFLLQGCGALLNAVGSFVHAVTQNNVVKALSPVAHGVAEQIGTVMQSIGTLLMQAVAPIFSGIMHIAIGVKDGMRRIKEVDAGEKALRALDAYIRATAFEAGLKKKDLNKLLSKAGKNVNIADLPFNLAKLLESREKLIKELGEKRTARNFRMVNIVYGLSAFVFTGLLLSGIVTLATATFGSAIAAGGFLILAGVKSHKQGRKVLNIFYPWKWLSQKLSKSRANGEIQRIGRTALDFSFVKETLRSFNEDLAAELSNHCGQHHVAHGSEVNDIQIRHRAHQARPEFEIHASS